MVGLDFDLWKLTELWEVGSPPSGLDICHAGKRSLFDGGVFDLD